MSILLSAMSPSDPAWQEAFTQASNRYIGQSVGYFVVAGLSYVIITKIARQAKDKRKKRLFLIRKIGVYLVMLSWIVFTGLAYGYIG